MQLKKCRPFLLTHAVCLGSGLLFRELRKCSSLTARLILSDDKKIRTSPESVVNICSRTPLFLAINSMERVWNVKVITNLTISQGHLFGFVYHLKCVGVRARACVWLNLVSWECGILILDHQKDPKSFIWRNERTLDDGWWVSLCSNTGWLWLSGQMCNGNLVSKTQNPIQTPAIHPEFVELKAEGLVWLPLRNTFVSLCFFFFESVDVFLSN